MPDREKVIKGLECCTKKVCIYKDTEKECPYLELCGEYEDAFEDCTSALAKDALALLKAQEPVEPKKNYVELAGLRTWDWACQECNCILTYRANYCSCCGRAVKWE